MEQIILHLAARSLTSKKGRSAMKTGCGMLVVGLFFLLLIPVILITIPILLLQAGTAAPANLAAVAAAREQIAYVERICEQTTGTELEAWIEQQRQELINAGIASEDITVMKSPAGDFRLKASEVIILWTALRGDEAVDNRIRNITGRFLTKDVHVSSKSDGTRYALITASLRVFESVLPEIGLSEEQESIARIMLDFSLGNNQMQSGGVWLGNDQTYNGGDLTFTDAQVNVRYYHQRDSRWANTRYAGESIGIAGCGPTAVAIVVSSLLERSITPKDVSAWSEDNGYAAYNNGSYNSLIPNAVQHYGLTVTGGNDAEALKTALREGKLAIAIMGPGSFTPSGHFIVLRGITAEGRILVADPVSSERSERSWDVQTILSEARQGAGSGGPIWIIEGK